MWTAITLAIVSIILVVVSILWYFDKVYFNERIEKLLLRAWYLEEDNKDLKIEVKRLRKLVKENKI